MAQNKIKVSCLGPEGSYSERAAMRLVEGGERVLCGSFRAAVKLLTAGEVDYAVVPIENAVNGGVRECLDLLAEEEVFGDAELPLLIDHRLATVEGCDPSKIERIYSHEQALAQCSEYLERRFPAARLIAVSSTTEGLNLLDERSAGIVGSHIVREGVTLSEENIADNKGNFTRFLRLCRAGALPEHSVMIFFCAVCAHKPGSLLGLLKIFLAHSLNLTRIESRPLKDSLGEYRFFVEFVGDIANERVRQALAEARSYCRQFKLLGAYR